MADVLTSSVLSDTGGQLTTLKSALSKTRGKFGDWMKQLESRLDEKEASHLEYIAKQQRKYTHSSSSRKFDVRKSSIFTIS